MCEVSVLLNGAVVGFWVWAIVSSQSPSVHVSFLPATCSSPMTCMLGSLVMWVCGCESAPVFLSASVSSIPTVTPVKHAVKKMLHCVHVKCCRNSHLKWAARRLSSISVASHLHTPGQLQCEVSANVRLSVWGKIIEIIRNNLKSSSDWLPKCGHARGWKSTRKQKLQCMLKVWQG